MDKSLYIIRHGLALHNKLFKDIGARTYKEFRDTPLLKEGYKQAKILSKWKNIKNIELVIVSSNSRAIETALFAFKDTNIPIISKDFLVEYPTGGSNICNKRKYLEDLRILYPKVIFEIEKNPIWTKEDETKKNLDLRIHDTLDWIGNRPEKEIAIVGHTTFLNAMTNNTILTYNNNLKHCYPYKFIAKYSMYNKCLDIRKI